jgi:hypothetical protein
LISGIAVSASTSANPIRCVNDTLPPRERARWLLITTRLSTSSFAGTARTEVAVGTVRLVSMFSTTRAAGPRSRSVSPSFSGPVRGACGGASRGTRPTPGEAAAIGAGRPGADRSACGAGDVSDGGGGIWTWCSAVPYRPRFPVGAALTSGWGEPFGRAEPAGGATGRAGGGATGPGRPAPLSVFAGGVGDAVPGLPCGTSDGL